LEFWPCFNLGPIGHLSSSAAKHPLLLTLPEQPGNILGGFEDFSFSKKYDAV
jgi:hypothetical protein